jgi:hypothetical protein
MKLASQLTNFLTATILLFMHAGCVPSGGTSTGNPVVSLKFAPYNGALSASNVSPQSVSSLILCFKRLRFKTPGEPSNPSPNLDSDNIDFYLGEVNISSLGTDLASAAVPPGAYARIEFDLDSSCPSGKSIQVTNTTGTFSTNQTITIKFIGSITITGETTVNMLAQNLVSAMNSVTADNQILAQAQAAGAEGTF